MKAGFYVVWRGQRRGKGGGGGDLVLRAGVSTAVAVFSPLKHSLNGQHETRVLRFTEGTGDKKGGGERERGVRGEGVAVRQTFLSRS